MHLRMGWAADKAEAPVTKKASEEGPVVLVFAQSARSPRPALLQVDEGGGLVGRRGVVAGDTASFLPRPRKDRSP